jgi:radical SAM superfamily enzyme YgiQ (UPF0313 family)
MALEELAKLGLPAQPLQVGVAPQGLIVVKAVLERLVKRFYGKVKLLS